MAKSRLRLTYDEERMIEGYALALDHVIFKLTGESPSAKSYDPMRIEGNVMHSYAFNMKDGGRHHPVEDYQSVGEILDCLLSETIDYVKEDG